MRVRGLLTDEYIRIPGCLFLHSYPPSYEIMSDLFSSASAEMEKILERIDGHRCLDNGTQKSD